MEEPEDEDLQLQRASGAALSTLTHILPRILFRASTEQRPRRVRRTVRQKDLERVVALIEPFQEEPQLLDASLKDILPPLVDAFIGLISKHEPAKSVEKDQKAHKEARLQPRRAICKVLYTLCKVRGEKVVSGFFNNEVRWLEPTLAAFERGTEHEANGSPNEDDSKSTSMTWEERYIMLLWLSHLMLVPFDLDSVSRRTSSVSQVQGIDLSSALPDIAQRVLPLCMEYLNSATRERAAAATLLARLVLRPDMRKLGLLDKLVAWALWFFDPSAAETTPIHQHIGILTFLSRLLVSARSEDVHGVAFSIYCKVLHVTNEETHGFDIINTSAVAKKLVIKILRNCVITYIQCAQDDSLRVKMDAAGVLEEVIDFLLRSLADRDTPVRFAASKALSMITQKLEVESAEEVVVAILGSLQEDIRGGQRADISAVNPLRWHGLTLTLAQLLYRRSPSSAQLPDILNALILSLKFEQRSATGSSVGANVRDAACFGIWSLSRRYTTKELASVDPNSFENATVAGNESSVLQTLAMELLVAACLDPVGNIRRGSSAALQELVGRHPDTIYEGISLVQIVDYHAVGLRQRAMIDVCSNASHLHSLYWKALFRNLLGWRGVGSPDAASRQYAATSIGKLCESQESSVVEDMIGQITMQLDRATTQLEERHGLLLAMSSIITIREIHVRHLLQDLGTAAPQKAAMEEIRHLTPLWSILEPPSSKALEIDLAATSTRSNFTAVAILSLMEALAKVSILAPHSVNRGAYDLLDLCIKHGTDEAVLQRIHAAVLRLASILTMEERQHLVDRWSGPLNALAAQIRLSTHFNMGFYFALAGIFPSLTANGAHQQTIVDLLCSTYQSAEESEARKRLLQAMRVGFLGPHVFLTMASSNRSRSLASIEQGLNDYTVNERGDVGSLVRMEALESMQHLWQNGLASAQETKTAYGSVVRLAAEKLDKVRLQAAHALVFGKGVDLALRTIDLSTVSTYNYFAALLNFVHGTGDIRLILALMEGYVTSAGLGSEGVIQASRQALVDWLSSLPIVDGSVSLLDVAEVLLDILKSDLTIEPISLPLLEVLAFLFDIQIFQRLIGTPYKWRTLLSLVQKSHHKSNNIPKITAAINVYRGLAEVDVVRDEVFRKLISMLRHPFPKVRVAVAEALFLITLDEELKPVDWGRPAAELHGVVEGFRGRHVRC